MAKPMARRFVPNHQQTIRLTQLGYPVVAGIDEVGRGSLAGPVVAAAVILSPTQRLPGVRDSKLLRADQRVKLARQIKISAVAVGLGWASSADIDRRGLTAAVKSSGLMALADLNSSFDAVILDGNHNYLRDDYFSQAIIAADQTCLNVAAASIVAKVARDQYMRAMHRLYPQFNFHLNKGYGTPSHYRAIQIGLSPIHRRLFKPVRVAAAYVD